MMSNGRIAGALVAVLAVLGSSAASAADMPSERYVVRKGVVETSVRRGYTGDLPSCTDGRVERWITATFAQRERLYWGSGLTLSAFGGQREIGYQSWGPDFIPRRFCSAHVTTTDGRQREIYWNLAEGLGRWTLGPGIDWCVTGLDRNYAYAPNCKMARP